MDERLELNKGLPTPEQAAVVSNTNIPNWNDVFLFTETDDINEAIVSTKETYAGIVWNDIFLFTDED